MKLLKRVLSCVCLLAMALSLTACGGGTSAEDENGTPTKIEFKNRLLE